MKLKKIMFMMNLRVFIICFVLGILSQPIVAALETYQSINMEGWWRPEKKGIHLSIPISAFIDGHILSIENSSPDCDVIIAIINESGETVYEQEVSAVNAVNIFIPMSEFPAGEYTLELTSPSGNYLRGNFTLYQ